MFIQGNLQEIFDALFSMGVINPALKADWSVAEKEKKNKSVQFMEMVRVVNKFNEKKQVVNNSKCSFDQSIEEENRVETLINDLKVFDQDTLMYLAMEVAREFVEFQDRKSIH